MTAQPGAWVPPGKDDAVRLVPPRAAEQIRRRTLAIAGICALGVIVAGAIAVGGTGVDDSAARVQQVAAGFVTAAGMAVVVSGMLLMRSGVDARSNAVHPGALRAAAVCLDVGTGIAWIGLVVLYVLTIFGENGGAPASNALALTVPLGGAALIATFVRRLPARLLAQATAYA